MDDTILPPGSLCRADETLESGHWAPPLQNRRVSMTFYDVKVENTRTQVILGIILSVHIGLCHPGPRSSGAEPFRHTLPCSQLGTKSFIIQGGCWVKCICACDVNSGHGVGEFSCVTAIFQLFQVHSSQAIHSVWQRSQMLKLCLS